MSKKMPKEITFHYKISPNYAMYKVSGTYGGIGAQGDIVANFYSERHPIPKTVTHELNKDGSLKHPPSGMEKKDGVIRDVLFGLSLTMPDARAVAKWLNDMADEREQMERDKRDRKGKE